MPTISPTYTQNRWSLEALFPSYDSPEMESAFQSLTDQVAAFEQIRDRLGPDLAPGEFVGFLDQLEAFTRAASRIYGYAGLWFNEDTQNQQAQAFQARVQQYMADLQNRTLFFELWWKGLDDNHAARLMDSAGDYAYWLEALRHFKPHTLSEPEEKIINLKDVTGSSALKTLYDTITNRYVFKIEADGEVQEVTRDGLMVYVQGQDPDLRARAYQELYRVYGQDGPILGQIYQALVRDWRNEQVNLRRFSSPMAVRNMANDIPDDVVDTLLQVSQDNAHLFQRYFRLKARWLGMDRLRRYDIYAPVTKADKAYPYDEAVGMVLEAFQKFDPQVADLANRIFAEERVDSQVRAGKSGGAFCWGVTPNLTPWVLLNYHGRARDLAVMAHELGHGIHNLLASQHNTLTFHPTLPLAETASTFGEMLLVDHLLARETDDAVRRDILFRQVDDAFATILRQVFFALFERQAHEMIHQGASVDDLSDAYMENLQAQFGDSVELSDEFRWEWVSIPHIYDRPFYVYAYAFGQLLVLSLYQQYKAEGEVFKPRYVKILSAGGSDAPACILTAAGVDIHSAEFWQGGFAAVESLIAQLESL